MKGQPGQDSKSRKPGIGQPGQYCQDMASRTEQIGQNITARTEQRGQQNWGKENWARTGRPDPGQSGWHCQNRKEQIGPPEHNSMVIGQDSWDKITVAGHSRQDSRRMTSGAEFPEQNSGNRFRILWALTFNGALISVARSRNYFPASTWKSRPILAKVRPIFTEKANQRSAEGSTKL
jgi:hypothetical protein